MLDRTNRFISQRKSATSPNIGPSTYYLPELFQKTLENYAPFLTLQEARPSSKSKETSPGPAGYYPKEIRPRIKGGTALWYTDARFKCTHYDQYETEVYEPFCDEISEETPVQGKGKVASGRVPYDLRGQTPTFPSQKNFNGYELTPYGTVCKYPSEDLDKTIGPAFYNPKDMTFTTERYKGNHFGMMKGKRSTGAADPDIPGPADYNVISDTSQSHFQVHMERLKEQRRKAAFLPRFCEAVQIENIRQNIPGPGRYDIPSITFNCSVIKERIHGQGFMSSAKRFVKAAPESFSPGPGDYVDHRTAFESLVKPGSMKDTGFLSDAPRFSKTIEITPGPGAYTIKGLQEERASPYYGKLRSFNSTKEREINFITKDMENSPGPASYTIVDYEYPTRPRNAVFKSVVSRSGQPSGKVYKSTAEFKKIEQAKLPQDETLNALKDANIAYEKKASGQAFRETVEEETARDLLNYYKDTFLFNKNIAKKFEKKMYTGDKNGEYEALNEVNNNNEDRKINVTVVDVNEDFICEEKISSFTETSDPIKAYKVTHGCHSHRIDSKTHMKIEGCGLGIFNKTERFGRVPDVVNKTVDPTNPGPAMYDIRQEFGRKGCTFTTVPRTALLETSVPGPGTYTIHPIYKDTILKRTFNVTLGKGIPRKKMPKMPWKLKLRAKKKLRWFEQGPISYRHCL